MALGTEFIHAAIPVASKDSCSTTLTLQNAGGPPVVFRADKVIGPARAIWRVHCPDGNPLYTISVLTVMSTAAIPANLDMPGAGVAVPQAMFRSDLPFLLDGTDRDWAIFAFQWDGPADSKLIISRAWPPAVSAS